MGHRRDHRRDAEPARKRVMPAPTLALSFAAGVLSFLSPCIVPLVPSYLSFVGGVAAGEAQRSAASRRVVILRTLLFVMGFTVVFVALGVLFSGSGALFANTGSLINIVSGVVVIFKKKSPACASATVSAI